MIIYLHGFDSNSPGNHEKVLQLQFIDPDVRLISYSTRHPKHDMQHLLKEVDKMLQLNIDDRPGADPGHRVLEWWATAGGATDHQDGGALREDSRTLVESVGELELLLVVE